MSNMTLSEFSRKGGNATVAKYGNGYMKELSKKAVAARKKKQNSRER